MIKILKEIFQIISFKQKVSFFYLQLSIIFSSLVELISIFTILLFVKISYNFDFVLKNYYLNFFFENYLNFNKYIFILYLGIFVLIFTLLSIAVSLFTNWFIIRFAEKTHQEISNIIYFKFINQTWKSNFSGTFSEFNSLIFNNLTEVKNRIFYSLFQINNKFFILLFFSLAIFIYSKYIFLIGLLILVILYIILFRFIKKIASSNSDKTVKIIDEKSKILSDSFLGIREISLLSLENKYYNRFNTLGNSIIKYVSKNVALSHLPRLIIEYFSYCFIVILIILIIKLSGHPEEILPTVIFLGFAGLKIIPSLNQIYVGFINIRIGIPYYKDLKKKFLLSLTKEDHERLSKNINKKVKKLQIKKSIVLKKIYLKYQNSSTYSLKDINLKIPIHKVIGITGHSGSGKSSLIDVILGFVNPTKGNVFIDGKIFKPSQMKSWQYNFSVLTNNIFFSNNSILENIAFGQDLKSIDLDKVENILKLLKINKIIEKLPNKYLTNINDKDAGFSSGEKQKISLARSLYFNKDFLILDEATNSLDSLSENYIINLITKIKSNKTIIIITHKIDTLKFCDLIFLLKDGSLVQQGTYRHLMSKNLIKKNLIN